MSPRYSLRSAIAAAILLLLFAQVIVAQTSGTIKGRVVDSATGDGLPGANVILVNTSIGTSTDLDGNYIIRLVPPGPWTVRASYIGYASTTVDINMSAGGELEQSFRLSPEVIVGEEVVVSAQAVGQMQAINQQLASNKIASIVSEARIQELPDFNAAQAISRLPGISTLQSSGEASKVVIRGLAPEFNQVSVSGISLASTGSSQIGVTSQPGLTGSVNNDRSVDLSMVSPYMIKTISVYKSLTPDLNANAIGGTVNMDLREAPTGLRSDMLWQSGYTSKSGKYGNYRGVVSLSSRFLDNALGVYALGNIEEYDRDADNMNASYSTALSDVDTTTGYRRVQVNDVTLNRHLETRQRYGANLILDYKFESGVIRSLNMFSRLNSETKDHNTILNYKDHHLDFRYREGENATDVGVNMIQFENDFGFMSMDVKTAYTYSQNSSPETPFYQFRQTGGVGSGAVPYNAVPEDLISTVVYRGTNDTHLNTASLFSSTYKETGLLFKADFKVPVNVGDVASGFIKIGGEHRRNKHTNDQSTPYVDLSGTSQISRQMVDSILARFPELVYNSSVNRFAAFNFTDGDEDLYKSFLEDKFGQVYWAADGKTLKAIINYIRNEPLFDAKNQDASNPGGWYYGLFQTLPNDYEYKENYTAAYAMAHMNIGSKFMIAGGARLEDVTSSYKAYLLLDGRNPATQTYKEVIAEPSNSFVLPMVQVKYDVLSWADVRYSYTQSLARPAYHQLSPRYSISYDHNNVWSGNPKLRPAKAFNHDLMLTFHSNELGLLSIGGFYKEIKDFTYSTSYRLRASPLPGYDSIGSYNDLGSPPRDGATLSTYVNSRHIAYVRGLEFDFQTRFWYLPFPLDGLLFGFNYTRITSQTSYPVRDEITFGIPGRPGYRIEQIDTTRSGRLIFQPNDVMNAFIGYDYKGFSTRVSFVFQGNSVSRVGTLQEQDGFTHDYYRVDISARQILPWAGLQLFLDLNNINNRSNISAQSSVGGFTNQQNYGLTLNFGVRYAYSGL